VEAFLLAPPPPRRRPGALARSTPARRRALHEAVRSGCESRPGTYRMLGRDGRVLYVGQSRALRTRLLSYFRARGRDRQARILRHAFGLDWEYAADPFAALLAELRLIKRHRPYLNCENAADEWPRAYVALTRGPVPGLRIVRRTDDPDADALWGPFRRVAALADAVRTLADLTGVRDCAIEDPGAGARALGFAADASSRSAGAARAPGCLRVELGTCAGPCIGAGRAGPYLAGVAAVRGFLDARSDALLRAARERMERAADALAFERAAAWRDRERRLAWLHGRLAEFQANMDRLSFRYRVRGASDRERVYLLRRGTVRAELPAPTTPEEHAALEALARRVYAGGEGALPPHDLEEFYRVASWFRRHPGEWARTTAGL
jgi:excinuclease ABC subunit C